MEQQTAALREALTGRYGDAVTVEYIDIYSEQMPEYPNVLRLLLRGDIAVPIISLNGEPTFAGGIAQDMIEEELQTRGLQPLA